MGEKKKGKVQRKRIISSLITDVASDVFDVQRGVQRWEKNLN